VAAGTFKHRAGSEILNGNWAFSGLHQNAVSEGAESLFEHWQSRSNSHGGLNACLVEPFYFKASRELGRQRL
jgi:hypothetical protein